LPFGNSDCKPKIRGHKSKGGKLIFNEKSDNQRISRERILIENINAKIKVFKITANKYRNKRKCFRLRMALICGIISFEIRNITAIVDTWRERTR
jgi:hypothetical protein